MVFFPYEEIVLTSYPSSGQVRTLVQSPGKLAKFYANNSIFNHRARFHVEQTFTEHGGTTGMVHIRGANNKYLVRTDNSLKLVADKPEDDKSLANCTLFRVGKTNFGKDVWSLVHVQLDRKVGTFPVGHGLEDCLGIEPSGMVETLFNVIDCRMLVRLPKRVTFKGDNGRFLGHRKVKGDNANQFADTDVAAENAMYEIFQRGTNGDIQVRTKKVGKLWRAVPGWIRSEANLGDNDPRTLFEVIKVGPNEITLRSRSINKFLKRLTTDGLTNCLNASVYAITKLSTLKVIEPLISRRVHVTEFRFHEARTYNDQIIAFVVQEACNITNSTDKISLSFKTETEHTGHWNNSQSMSTGQSFGLTAGIPKIGFGMEFSVEETITKQYKWGESHGRSIEINDKGTYEVPPFSRTTVKMIVRAVTYEIPFSYTQDDVYTDGTSDNSTYEDGIFIGSNAYKIEYTSSNERLPPSDIGDPEGLSLVNDDTSISTIDEVEPLSTPLA